MQLPVLGAMCSPGVTAWASRDHGADRRPLPPAGGGWRSWCRSLHFPQHHRGCTHLGKERWVWWEQALRPSDSTRNLGLSCREGLLGEVPPLLTVLLGPQVYSPQAEMNPFAELPEDAPNSSVLPPRSELPLRGALGSRHRLLEPHQSRSSRVLLFLSCCLIPWPSSVLTLPGHQQLWIQRPLLDSPPSLGFQDTSLCCLTLPPPRVPLPLPSFCSEPITSSFCLRLPPWRS